jgi:hypothetical protein
VISQRRLANRVLVSGSSYASRSRTNVLRLTAVAYNCGVRPVSRTVVFVLGLLAAALCAGLVTVRSHVLIPHGRATCAGRPVADATVFRSQRGDLFIYAPSLDSQLAIVTPNSPILGLCNRPNFTPVFGLLFSRAPKPDEQCTSMWKGGADVDPPHVVTDTYATFPWGACPTLRVDYEGRNAHPTSNLTEMRSSRPTSSRAYPTPHYPF